MIVPRYYQNEAVAALWRYFGEEEGNPLVAMPTGTGKALVIALFIQSVFLDARGIRILMLTHVKELIRQNADELLDLWPTAPLGIYSAGLKLRQVRPITFAGIDSVANCPEVLGAFDLVIIDEAHLVGPKEGSDYRKLLGYLQALNPNMRVVGLTATPYRLSQGLLTDPTFVKKEKVPPLFTKICYDVTGLEEFNRLVDEGYICPLIPKQTQTELDVSEVAIQSTGDFNQKELQAASDKEEITFRAVREMIELGSDRWHWLIFATGVEHCEHVCEMLESQGVSAVAVHSKMTDAQRDINTGRFRRGEVRALVNNGVYTTGFNFKPIDLIGMLRATASPGLWVQMLGRGTRPYDFNTERDPALAETSPFVKSNCLVLDFAGNTRRLGPINDPRIPKKKGKRQGEPAPVKLCPACNTWNHASARVCISCKEEFPKGAVRIVGTADSRELIARETNKPKVDTLKVSNVVYGEYQKSDRPPSIRVTYRCGGKFITEFVCFEHLGLARKKALEWWKQRVPDALPATSPKTTKEAMTLLKKLPVATHIKVWSNQKYPQVLGYDFTGTAFGSELTPGTAPSASVEEPQQPRQFTEDLVDADVPF